MHPFRVSRLHRVAVLVLAGAKPLDVGIPAQVFTTRASMPYEVRVCGAAPGLVSGGDGLSYAVEHGLDALAWADLVFVPGYRFPDRDDPPQGCRRPDYRVADLVMLPVRDHTLRNTEPPLPADPLRDHGHRHVQPDLKQILDLRLHRIHDRALRRPVRSFTTRARGRS